MKSFLGYVAVIGIMFAGAFNVTGCKGSEQVAARVAVSYATAKLIEKSEPGEARAQKAAEILAVADKVDELASGESMTVDALRAYVASRLSHLSPADRMLAGVLIDEAARALREKIGDGVIDPERLVKVREVLSWVREGAISYVPTDPES
jgi:predicted RecB family endonuclease